MNAEGAGRSQRVRRSDGHTIEQAAHHEHEGGEAERAQHHSAQELRGGPPPWSRCAKTARIAPNTGIGDRLPAIAGPSAAATEVRTRTSRAAIAMRIIRSPGKRRRGGRGGAPPAMSAPTPASAAHTRANASPSGSMAPRNTSVDTREGAERGGQAAGPSQASGHGAVGEAERRERDEPEERAQRGARGELGTLLEREDEAHGAGGQRQSRQPSADRGSPAAPGERRDENERGRQQDLQQCRRRHGLYGLTGGHSCPPARSLDTLERGSHTPSALVSRAPIRCPRNAPLLLPRKCRPRASGLGGSPCSSARQ